MENKSLELSQDLEIILTNSPVDLEMAIDKAKELSGQISHYLTDAMINNRVPLLKSWSYEAKSFVILLRDTCFQIYKSGVLNIPQEGTTNHFIKISELIATAKEDLSTKYLEAVNTVAIPDKWKHFHDPTPTVINQIEELCDQMSTFPETKETLLSSSDQMEHIKDNIGNLLNQYSQDVNFLENGFMGLYNNYILKGDFLLIGKLLGFKKTLERNYKTFQEIIIEKAKPKLTKIDQGKTIIPIKVQNGKLIYKEIDVLKEVQNWNDKIIYPSLLECEKYLEILHEKSSRIILNTKNRVDLFQAESQDDITSATATIKNTWESSFYELESLIKDFNELKEFLESKIESLTVTDIFKNDRFFLEKKDDLHEEDDFQDEKWVDLMPVKKSLEIIENIKSRLSKSGIIKNQGLTDIIQFVKGKSVHDIDRVTYSLFLNKGYLGNSFVVKRDNIISLIAKDIENWEEGFRGSVLLFGKRLSGKSTIIESLPYYLPKVKILSLVTKSTIEFKSRKLELQYNLEDALDFIIKNSVSDKIIVAIDDLELWRDSNGLLYENTKVLMDCLNKYSKRLFFIVVTNHWFKRQLDNYFNFSSKFTSAINTDEMSISNIKKAILLRHAASLKDAVYHDNLPKENKELNVDLLAKKVAIGSHQIIGASLKEWAHVYNIGNANSARFQKHLPEGMIRIIQDRWTIFQFILKFKITSEKELVKTLGSTFLKEISPDIQFLISCKILERDNKNNLMINDYIVDEIESHFLKNKEFYRGL
jgi:hypothetical protein